MYEICYALKEYFIHNGEGSVSVGYSSEEIYIHQHIIGIHSVIPSEFEEMTLDIPVKFKYVGEVRPVRFV